MKFSERRTIYEDLTKEISGSAKKYFREIRVRSFLNAEEQLIYMKCIHQITASLQEKTMNPSEIKQWMRSQDVEKMTAVAKQIETEIRSKDKESIVQELRRYNMAIWEEEKQAKETER